MSDLGNLSNLAGANSAFARSVPAARAESLAPATVQDAVSPPINMPQTAVTQLPTASSAEWQRRTDPDGQPPRPPAAPDPEQLVAAIDDLNQRLSRYQTDLRFDIDNHQGMVVRVVDQETKAVVLQIPSETALALAKAFKELEANNQLGSLPSPPGKTSDPGKPRSPMDGWLLRATA